MVTRGGMNNSAETENKAVYKIFTALSKEAPQCSLGGCCSQWHESAECRPEASNIHLQTFKLELEDMMVAVEGCGCILLPSM